MSWKFVDAQWKIMTQVLENHQLRLTTLGNDFIY